MGLEAESEELLGGRASQIVAVIGADGRPIATRGWGLTPVDREAQRWRLLLDADDEDELAHLAGGGAIAVTASDVQTLKSVQIKGRVEEFLPVTDADRAKWDDHCDGFFDDVERADHIPRHEIERIRPFGIIACTIVVDEMFDQTPGPAAGTALAGAGDG